MSDTRIHAEAAEERGLVRLGRFLRDNPVIPLILFLILLIFAHFYVVMPLRTGRTGALSAFSAAGFTTPDADSEAVASTGAVSCLGAALSS